MILGIATIVILVLLAIAFLPMRRREPLERIDSVLKQSANPVGIFQSEPSRPINLREQQVQEEASAVSAEYERCTDEVWLEEIRTKPRRYWHRRRSRGKYERHVEGGPEVASGETDDARLSRGDLSTW